MNHIPSPDTSDAGIERLIQTKGKTAARVTPQDIERAITSEHYFTAGQAVEQQTAPHEQIPTSLYLLTFCVLTLRNGFTVTGESACVSPENFDVQIGRAIARQNAVQKIWPLLGFALKERLHAEGG